MPSIHARTRPAYVQGLLSLLTGIALALSGWAMTEAAAADPSTPDPAAAALEQLRAANQARAAWARDAATWISEQQRLQALRDATRAETARLDRDAVVAEAARDAARMQLASLGTSSDLDAIRTRLTQAGEQLSTSLTALAATLPPGIVPVAAGSGDDATFDVAVRALEMAERACGAVAVDVISGTRAGKSEAVKALRVAGAAAWWVSLDGTAAGTLHVDHGRVVLEEEADEAARAAIMNALAQAEGRAQPAVAILPAPRLTGGAP